MNNNYVEAMFVNLLMKTNLNGLINNNEELLNRCYEIKQKFPQKSTWFCDTYNSLKSYNLKEDQLFKPLIDLCASKVFDFAREYGIEDRNLFCTDAWFNIASKGNYQEFHIHPMSHFSVVYYVDVREDSGRILFKNPQSNLDMFTLPPNTSLTIGSRGVYFHKPAIQDLLIFRSNTPHMVEKNNNNSDRISIAMNFVVE